MLIIFLVLPPPYLLRYLYSFICSCVVAVQYYLSLVSFVIVKNKDFNVCLFVFILYAFLIVKLFIPRIFIKSSYLSVFTTISSANLNIFIISLFIPMEYFHFTLFIAPSNERINVYHPPLIIITSSWLFPQMFTV